MEAKQPYLKSSDMYYPAIERRMTVKDRRVSHADRRQGHRDHSPSIERRGETKRRSDKERRVLSLDHEKMLALIATLPKKKKLPWYDILNLTLVPVVLGFATIYVTYNVNRQQLQNAQILAESQRTSSEQIAAANRENSNNIARAEIETQHLRHMVDIFSSIINPAPKDYKSSTWKDTLTQRVQSLAVYGDEALPFLLQLREHKQNQDNGEYGDPIAEASTKTIREILQQSQPNLSEMEFKGDKERPLNLRKREYMNYNLSQGTFSHVNLFKANFASASLQGATFTQADLQDANFEDANLRGVVFEKANLRKTNFKGAYLKNVEFRTCDHIEDAYFSLKTLLRADSEPFKSIPARKYTLLLMQYEDDLEQLHLKKPYSLHAVFDKLNMADFEALQRKFSELRRLGVAKSLTTART